MPENIGNENPTVKNPLINYATEIGWEYVPRQDAVSYRQGEGGLLFHRILSDKLIELNPGLVTLENVNEIIQRIEAVSNTIDGNAEIMSWLREEQSIHDPKEKRRRNVVLIDYENIEKNVFQVTDEWQYTNGREKNRADIIFLINGIPVAIVETKSASKEDALEKGLIQIREYHHETPEMMTMPQVFDITHVLKFYYGATWNLDSKNVIPWKTEGNYENKVKRFFEPSGFLVMLKEWILFYIKDDELCKTVLWQHQSRAVQKILDRCADTTKKTGLIWHTQGSGKTFTMLTTARQIFERKDTFSKPTVILVIDRNELQGQLKGWVENLLGELKNFDVKIEYATNKRRLRELLKSDFRGLIVSMIHKFDEIPKDINTRDNIYIMLDEAHRSVGGDLGNYLTGALPNATMIGFTGTPIDKTAYGKGTFKIFGKEDDRGYLDKYSTAESIEDGTTLELKYEYASNDIMAPKQMIEEEFLNLAEAQGVSDVEELNRILDKAVKIKAFLKSKDRVEKVAQFVAKHFRERVEPHGYKAFLVAVDRDACAQYKEALDKILPGYAETIYSKAQHDSENYPLVHKHQPSEDEEKSYRKLFVKSATSPKILIVTDKLLTGYDAPILYCMYLDKPMRDHVLLQAIARINRPYEPEPDVKKPCGLVVDFVSIFEKLEKALAFDSDEVKGVIENIDAVFEKFEQIMKRDAQQYIDLCKPPINDKAVEKAVDYFYDKEKREAFYTLCKGMKMLYDILSPSSKLRDYIEDVYSLGQLYRIIRNAYGGDELVGLDLVKKTENLIKESARTYIVNEITKSVKIDADTLRAIKEKHNSDNSKIINLSNSALRTIREDGEQEPYLKPIGERVEEIQDAYYERQITTQVALRRIEDIIKEINDAREKRKETQMDINTYSILLDLNRENVKGAETHASAVNSVFERFPNYNHNVEEMRQLKAELYGLLLPIVGKDSMITLVEKLLKITRK